MIHYHGTPVGGPGWGVERFLKDRHALVPFARPDDLDRVGRNAASFILDNSAFSHWKRGGGRVDVAAYHAWVHSVADHPGLDWCLIPDTIDGSEEENIDLVTTWLRMGSRVKSVPVWHLHESLGWLDYLVQHFEIVALGSSGQWRSPGTSRWWDRMTEAMGVACDEHGRPRCQLHGLRMLDPEIFTRLPLASADSANAAINCGSRDRWGSYMPRHAWQRATVIAWSCEDHDSPATWCGRGEQQALRLEATR